MDEDAGIKELERLIRLEKLKTFPTTPEEMDAELARMDAEGFTCDELTEEGIKRIVGYAMKKIEEGIVD